MDRKVAIVGGCGHVGIPLGLALAAKGFHVSLVDINEKAVEAINSGRLPFREEGAEALFEKHLGKNLCATTDSAVISVSDVVVFVTGTPVDEHLNPRVSDVVNVVRRYMPLMSERQLVILRSTIFPGSSKVIDGVLRERFAKPKLAFCPERIVQGKGIEEIHNLPQIVSGTSPEAVAEAADLFSKVAPKIILLETEEAELAKLMTNSWRYLEFAIANQFYMMAGQRGLDFHKIFDAMTDSYPRAANFARPGLAAGPCLFKDTMQLAAFHNNNFFLGHSAMLVNEGLPSFLVERLEEKVPGGLAGRKVAILGMTFKADNDDIRESLSFKIKKCLEAKMAKVLPSDPYLKDSIPLERALAEADGIIVGTPHKEYRSLRPSQPYMDCWGIWRDRKVKS